jgi:hypothetical protein
MRKGKVVGPAAAEGILMKATPEWMAAMELRYPDPSPAPVPAPSPPPEIPEEELKPYPKPR